MPPAFCASAVTCRARVVFPEDSGPKISEMRPRGNPPMPSAASTEMDPVEMVGTACTACAPRRITEPLPNCFSICPRVAPRARARSFSSMEVPLDLGGTLIIARGIKQIVGSLLRGGIRRSRLHPAELLIDLAEGFFHLRFFRRVRRGLQISTQARRGFGPGLFLNQNRAQQVMVLGVGLFPVRLYRLVRALFGGIVILQLKMRQGVEVVGGRKLVGIQMQQLIGP